MDLIAQIKAFNAGREPERLQMKYTRMRVSAFAFMRGNCGLFYAQLPREGIFKSAPLAWSCGDLHLENFGSYKGDNRLAYFDVNDFDEAALAPASWDMVRFLSSVLVWAQDFALSESDAQALVQTAQEAYATALSVGKAHWIERETAEGIVRSLLDGLRDRKRTDFLNQRTVTKAKQRRLLVEGSKALPATDAQRETVSAFMAEFAAQQMNPKFFKVLDVARRVAGTGSLGLDRYAILVAGKGSPDGNYLLDLKEAMPSSLVPPLKKVEQPRWKSEAHRIVDSQRRLQAVSMAFLQPTVMNGRAYVLRALQPSQDRLVLSVAGKSRRTQAELLQLMSSMGRLIAWAQLRSAGQQGSATVDELIDFGKRSKWRDKLLLAAQDCAALVRKDAAAYSAAYDQGAFKI